MLRFKIACCALITAFVFISLFGTAQFTDSASLKIGHPAPPLKIHAWAKGNPIKKFEKGKVYVVDFWATWCGGCIASFPHLSAIAEKYKGRVKFFSVDSYEEIGENKGKEMLPVIKEFLKTPAGQNLKIDVAIDGPGNPMFNAWIKTIRRQGFPTTFIIDQKGRVAWIDVNLDQLDWALEQVVSNTWNIEKAAEIMEQKEDLDAMWMKYFQTKEDEEKKKIASEMLSKAEALEKKYPDRKDAVAFAKAIALMELDEQKLPVHFEEMAENPLSRYIHISDAISLIEMKGNPSIRMYEAMIKGQERLLQNPHPGTGFGGKSVKAYENLAASYSKVGQVDKAIANQEKAIEMTKEKNTPADQLEKLEKTLTEYKGATATTQKTKLEIGDAAPPLKYSKWIQGPDTIKTLDNNKFYVIEFWATWCGPCIQAMPHLSELSKKYAGKIDFIGCDVWENMYGGPKDQEHYTPKVTNFVNDQFKKGRLTYNVIMDNTAEDMGNTWLKAAGLSGIPSSFVIQNGKIMWIGHPHYLDSILVGILEGKYDVQAEKKRQRDQAEMIAQKSAGFNNAIKAYKDAEAANNYDKALQLMDSAIINFPDNKFMFVTDKFLLLQKHLGDDKAIAYGMELQKEKLPGQVLIANLYSKENSSKKVNEFAAKALKAWGEDNPKVLDIRATFEARVGRFKDAAATQKKAIEVAKAQKDNPGMTESVISDMQKKAEDYVKKADRYGKKTGVK